MAKVTNSYEMMPVESLVSYEKNARTHSDEQVEKICKSIKEFGFVNPVLVNKDNVIIAGHGRVMASKKMGITEVPCLRIEHLTDEQMRAYVIADNKLAEDAGWDMELLKFELEELHDLDFDISLTGFTLEDIKEFEENEEVTEVEGDNFDEEPPGEPQTKVGDIYQLGEHRLMCGDSTSVTDIDKLTGGAKVDLVFTDPPYGMKKECDGVTNDNLNFDDLLEFNRQWIPLSFATLKDNGSWYCWGIEEPLMDIYAEILKPMKKENRITFRNLITWDKGNAQGQLWKGLRKYAQADEKCLFVMTGVQGFNTNFDNYYEAWEPVRLYLEGEAKKVGLTSKKLKEICGVGMYGHWFTKSQFQLIPEEHYKKLQDAFKRDYDAFKRDYDEIKRDYDEIKRDYYSTRAYFDNCHDNMNSVWHFNNTEGAERESAGGHATPKPLALCARAIKSSSRQGETVLDLFGGSGSTMMACEQLGRKSLLMELEPKWCDVIINRWETFTGRKAVKVK